MDGWGRPQFAEPETERVYAWLASNGIQEWLPENPMITVDGEEIRYTSFAWIGPRGWNPEHIHPTGETVTRVVLLRVPPPADVADLIDQLAVFAVGFGRSV